jgi:hypothetical protein
MKENEVVNAVIKSVSIDTGDRDLLTAWIHLDYGSGGQGFGGHALYLPKSYTHFTEKGDFAGHFIFRCMEIGDVQEWAKLAGKSVRVKIENGLAVAVGHIIKNDWFNPSADFEKMRS